MKLTYESIVTFVKDGFGLIAVIAMLVTGLGFSLSPPWASASEIATIQEQMRDLRQDLKSTTCLALMVLLNDEERDLERAQAELKTDPASASAQREVRKAQAQIADIETQMRDSKCSTIR